MEMIWAKFEKVETNGEWVKRKFLWDKYEADYEWKDRYYKVEVLDWKIYQGKTYAIAKHEEGIETIPAENLRTVEFHKEEQNFWAHDKERTEDLKIISFELPC